MAPTRPHTLVAYLARVASRHIRCTNRRSGSAAARRWSGGGAGIADAGQPRAARIAASPTQPQRARSERHGSDRRANGRQRSCDGHPSRSTPRNSGPCQRRLWAVEHRAGTPGLGNARRPAAAMRHAQQPKPRQRCRRRASRRRHGTDGCQPRRSTAWWRMRTTTKKTTRPSPLGATDACWIDPALTYFRARHYHRPWLLDCRVRKGNGYFQPGMGTGRRLICRASGAGDSRRCWVGGTSRRGIE